jgi:hypothetical protein
VLALPADIKLTLVVELSGFASLSETNGRFLNLHLPSTPPLRPGLNLFGQIYQRCGTRSSRILRASIASIQKRGAVVLSGSDVRAGHLELLDVAPEVARLLMELVPTVCPKSLDARQGVPSICTSARWRDGRRKGGSHNRGAAA